MGKSKSGRPAQGDLLLRQRHVNTVFTASRTEELLLNTRLTEEIKSNARELLKEFGLYEYRDAHPSTLSGGQKQRLSLARALIRTPKILILDDCTSALDADTEARVLSSICETARGMSVLLISQRISTVMKVDRILCLENGLMRAWHAR